MTTIYGQITSACTYIPFSVISTSLATLRSLLRSRNHNAILFMLVCASVQCWMSMHPSTFFKTPIASGFTNKGSNQNQPVTCSLSFVHPPDTPASKLATHRHQQSLGTPIVPLNM